jgi:hypothetical protein
MHIAIPHCYPCDPKGIHDEDVLAGRGALLSRKHSNDDGLKIVLDA